MAGEIRLQAETGNTVKALIVAEDGTVWNGSALVATSTLTDANWTASLIACTEQQTSEAAGAGLYLANWPGALTQDAIYSVQYFTGASPSPGDLVFGSQQDPTEYVIAKIDGIAGGAGSGARTVTVTVNDGATVLENATVRHTEGANTFTGLTNASGVIVFSLDDATYAVSITKDGYSFTPTTKIVNGTEADTYSMSVVAITAPPNASTTTGTMTLIDEQGVAESGVTITVQIIGGPGTAGIGYDSKPWAKTSDGDGLVEFAGIVLGAEYKIWRGTSKPKAKTFTAPSSGTSFDLAEVIGRG